MAEPPHDPGAPPPLPPDWVHRTAKRTWRGPLDAGSAPSLPWLRRSLEVLRVLARADFRARYRAQALGVVWSLLNPLVMMGIISIVFSRFFGSDVPNYPVFLLIGLVIWQWSTQAITAGTQSFVSHAELIKRTVFARQTLPIASVLSYFINFSVESLIVVAFAAIFPHAYRLSPALLLVPIYLALYGVLLVGIVLATSVLNLIYRDVAYLVSTALTILYWATPIMYPVERVPEPWRQILMWNPLGGILNAIRNAVMLGRVASGREWVMMVAPTAILFLLGWGIFRRFERMALDHV